MLKNSHKLKITMVVLRPSFTKNPWCKALCKMHKNCIKTSFSQAASHLLTVKRGFLFDCRRTTDNTLTRWSTVQWQTPLRLFWQRKMPSLSARWVICEDWQWSLHQLLTICRVWMCPPCVSQLNYKAGYEKTKHQYTLSKDLPQIRNAKANAALCSDVSCNKLGVSMYTSCFTWSQILTLHSNLSLQIKYKEEWEKTKSKACDIGVDDLSVRAAKASRDLASDVSKQAHFFPNWDNTVVW